MIRHTHDVVQTWLDVAARNRDTDAFRVSFTAFRALLDGRTPSVHEIAESIAMPLSNLAMLVSTLSEQGRLTLDQSGTVITGAGGLSLVESRHTLDMLGRRYWVWCALDAVGIPAGLDVDAMIHSRTADNGESVEIAIATGELRRSRPENPLISLLPPTLEQSLHDSCCSEINFFADAGRLPASTTPVTIEEAMQLGSQLWRDSVPL